MPGKDIKKQKRINEKKYKESIKYEKKLYESWVKLKDTLQNDGNKVWDSYENFSIDLMRSILRSGSSLEDKQDNLNSLSLRCMVQQNQILISQNTMILELLERIRKKIW